MVDFAPVGATADLVTDAASNIRKQIQDCISLKHTLYSSVGVLLSIAESWTSSLQAGGKVIFLGNGGSAADAQHLAAELAGKFYLDREPLAAIALNTNTSVITAIGNDFGYEDIFAHQVRALARPGDVVVGISTSGNSPNVIKAMEEAKLAGAVTVAFTGAGGVLRDVADITFSVASTDTPRIQEVHITAGHLVCYLVERSLFGKP